MKACNCPQGILTVMRTALSVWLLAGLVSPAIAEGGRSKARAPGAAAALGSQENPVRAYMPAGEREYLLRLRCPAGDAPKFERIGSIGPGTDGHTLDDYLVECADDTTASVVIDMYHHGYREQRAVPGFSVLPELPARVAKGCPPEVPGTPAGQYVFNALEVESPARIAREALEAWRPGVSGRVYVRVIVEATGIPEAASVEITHADNEEIRGLASDLVKALRFEPAQHHAGCAVPQYVQFPVTFR